MVSGQQRKVYFTQGHGEKDTASPERDGYSAIAAALGRENYTVEKVVLAQAGAVPDDASVVVVAGPQIDFFPPEIDALKKYLDKAGKLLLELDPPDKPDSPPLTNLIALAHDWGVDVGNNVVVDVSGMGRLIGHRRVRAGGRQLPVARDHAALQLPHRVPAGAIGHAGDGRRQRPHRAAVRSRRARKSWAEADIKRPAGDRAGGARRGEGRQEGAGRRSAPRCRLPRASAPPTRPSRPPPTRRSRKRGSW